MRSGFRILSHSDMSYRTYFQRSGSHFSRFWRPAGKQVFSVIATASSSKPSKTCNSLLLLEN